MLFAGFLFLLVGLLAWEQVLAELDNLIVQSEKRILHILRQTGHPGTRLSTVDLLVDWQRTVVAFNRDDVLRLLDFGLHNLIYNKLKHQINNGLFFLIYLSKYSCSKCSPLFTTCNCLFWYDYCCIFSNIGSEFNSNICSIGFLLR